MHVRVAGAYFEGKMGYRNDATLGVAVGDEPLCLTMQQLFLPNGAQLVRLRVEMCGPEGVQLRAGDAAPGRPPPYTI